MTKNNYSVLFRYWDEESKREFETCSEYFPSTPQRCNLKNSIVIGRYSVLPYYLELEKDLQIHNCRLINSYSQHQYISNFDYYDFLRDYTFQSWDENQFNHIEWGGPFIVKGACNSRKDKWNKLMFAKDAKSAAEIAHELKTDGMINGQNIIFRKYQPLKTFEIGINDQPFTNEWRFFVYNEKIISFGYYWIQAENVRENIEEKGLQFIAELLNYIRINKPDNFPNFYVLDIGELETNEWILIEMNDGQMSGLSNNNPEILYKNLKKELCKEK
jgi:hypothetical protein